MFQVLSEHLQKRDIAFHVHFMSRKPSHRPEDWRLSSQDIQFSHSFWGDIGPRLKGKKWHLNPGLVSALMFKRADYLMVGGPWASITAMLLSFLARRTIAIGWQEGTSHAPGNLGRLAVLAKRFLLRPYQVLAVPGHEGEMHALLFVEKVANRPRIVMLPNIVDETKFKPTWLDDKDDRNRMRLELGITNEERIALWPARLIPEKGVPEFLTKLKPEDLSGWKLLIAGDGPMREQVTKVISDRLLDGIVRIVPPVPYSQMPELYRIADLFLLPSLLDRNPLSVVEAMHSGLAILVSNRIGNFHEALQQGVNGWGVDPSDPNSVRQVVRTALSLRPDQLREMGKKSWEMAGQLWGSDKAIDSFLDSIPVKN